MKLKRAKEGKKSLQLQALNCRPPDVLVRATLSSSPGGMDFFLKPEVFILFRLYSEPGLQTTCAAALELPNLIYVQGVK